MFFFWDVILKNIVIFEISTPESVKIKTLPKGRGLLILKVLVWVRIRLK